MGSKVDSFVNETQWNSTPVPVKYIESEPTLSEKERRISDTRQSTYGSWQANMAATSENMSGLYRQWQANNPGKSLPSWWAPLMQVIVKLNRVASGRFHQDNFDDARVYLSFVEQLQQEEAACGGTTSTTAPTTTTPATTPGDARE